MYDRPHYMLTFGGTAVTGLEQWQTGLRFAPGGGVTESDLLDQLATISVQDIFEDFAPIIANTDSIMAYPQTLVARFAKLAVLNTSGKYAGAPKLYEGNVPGSNPVNATGVPQIAWVATLGTGHKFGMAQSGRMYWPCPLNVPGTLAGATGQVPQVHCDAFRNQLITAIEAAEGEVSTAFVPVSAAVMSLNGGRTAPTAPGTTNYITEVSVGRILDTQRRRRGELQEAYMPAPAARGNRTSELAPPRRRQ